MVRGYRGAEENESCSEEGRGSQSREEEREECRLCDVSARTGFLMICPTYHHRAIDALLNLARCSLLLVAKLLLLNLGGCACAACRRQAYSYVCYLQDREGEQRAQESGYRIGDEIVEFERIERANKNRVNVRVNTRGVGVEGLDGCCGRLWCWDSGDAGCAGHCAE
jgi:hypothetical protein